MPALERLASDIRAAQQTVAFTGAGVSTASGIPDFRGDGGVWERHDPADVHYERFRRDPAGFWEARLALHETMYGGRAPVPNAAHDAFAELARDGHLEAIITQNVDGLHAAAAEAATVTLEIVELHGNASTVSCQDCGRSEDVGHAFDAVRTGQTPPRCDACHGILKPGVVLFGEPLNTGDLDRARDLARAADVFLVAGSSLTVEPAASLPRLAARTGATLAVINLDQTPSSGTADYEFQADVTDVLPRLQTAVGGSPEASTPQE